MEQGNDNWHDFLQLCLKIEDEKKLDKFFDLFLTYEEKDAITTRYAIVRELLKGEKTQREIASDLNVSIAKITRGSNYLKTIDSEFKDFLKQLLA